MDDINSILDGEMDRRTFGSTVAGLGISALAGCGGKTKQQSQPNSNGSDSEPKETNNPKSEGYNTEEPQSTAEQQIMGAAEQEEIYAIKIEGSEYINSDGLIDESSGVKNYEQALAAVMSYSGEDLESMWFSFVKNNNGSIDMIPNAEDQSSGIEVGVQGYPVSDLEESQSLSESEIEREYSEFISERIDGDGVVNHAGEIPDYAREALENGWQA